MQKRYSRDNDCESHEPVLSVGVKLVASSAAVTWGGRLSSARRHRAGFRDYLTPLSILVSARTANTTFVPNVYSRYEFVRLSTSLFS
jgi:hypothetical protein